MDRGQTIINKENQLREWFTRKCDPIRKVIDGLDIGWGGVQRNVTSQMIMQPASRHLDVACGYGTFLAQLGWKFPEIRFTGLNLDYQGAHSTIHDLLAEANVPALLVQADARRMPFPNSMFASASCFLGLQDIKIGSGDKGVKETINEMLRVVQKYGHITLVDEFSSTEFHRYLSDLPASITNECTLTVDVKWKRHVAEEAIKLYAQGWIAQTELTRQFDKERAYTKIYQEMKRHMEEQLQKNGYYVPFDRLHMVIAQLV